MIRPQNHYTAFGYAEHARKLTVMQYASPDPFAVAELARAQYRRVYGDWRLVVIYGGKRELAAEASATALGPPRVRKPALYTVFGYWLHSGETFSMPEEGNDAPEAMTLARHTYQRDGLRLLGVVAGDLKPMLRAESLPDNYR